MGMGRSGWPCVSVAIFAALLTSTAVGQKHPAVSRPKLTAEYVMDQGAAAMGPKSAWDKIQSSIMEGSLTAIGPGTKLSGTLVLRAKRPNKFVLQQNVKGVGVTLQGYDGKVGWSKDPVRGLRKLEGAELAAVRRAAWFDAHIRWRPLYKKWQLVGTRKVKGRAAYLVRLIPAVGPMTLEYHDTKTFRLVRTDMVTETPQGPLPIEVYPENYRSVKGALIPFTVRQRQKHPNGTVEVVIRIKTVRTNVPVSDSLFAMPKS